MSSINLGKESLSTLGAKTALSAFGFVGFVIFARFLGPEKIGVYGAILAAGRLLSKPSIGVGSGVRKRVSESRLSPEELLTVGVALHLLYAAVAVALLFVLTQLIDGIPILDQYAVDVVFIFFPIGLFTIASYCYAGLGNPAASEWIDSGQSLLALLIQLALLAVGYEVHGLIAGLSLATFGSIVWVFYVSDVWFRIPSRDSVNSILSFVRWSVPNEVVRDVFVQADVLIALVLLGADQSGFYEASIRLTIPAVLVSSALAQSLTVKTSQDISSGKNVISDVRNTISYAGLVAIPIAFGAFAIGEELMVTVYRPAFAGTGPILVGLAVYRFFDAYRVLFAGVLNGIDKPDLLFRVEASMILLYLPLSVFFAIEFGLIGIVAATILTEILRVLVLLVSLHQLFDDWLVTKPILAQVSSGAIMYLGVRCSKELIVIDSWLPLLGILCVGVVLYFGSLMILSSHFRETIVNVVGDV